MLESEETGFSAIEEEVKSNQMMNRPTVYAGMNAKRGSKNDEVEYDEDTYGHQAYADLINQYVDNPLGQGGVRHSYID